MSDKIDLPVVCRLDEGDRAQRRVTAEALFDRAQATEELADGYAFRFPGRDEWADDLLAFVLAERQCCPFFTFELRFAPAQGPIWLGLRGGADVKAYLRSQLDQIEVEGTATPGSVTT